MRDLLERWQLQRVINATGTVTRLGASRMHPDVIEAMAQAADCSIDIAGLQGHAADLIATVTGAEAGIVTAGAAAGLLVGAAACIAGFDPVKMGRLPDTAGMRNEFIVARSHRNSYDHAVRAAGAQLVEVGLPDRLTGCGVRDTEAWEYAAAIGERTAGILYLATAGSRPSLAEVARVAHAKQVPVLVDAAAEVPPAGNLRRFIEEGADLVVFSGGKGIGGPSASGVLCGRRDLVGSALLQQLDLDFVSEDWRPPAHLIDRAALRGVPRHGIGRSCKVGKEQIVGLMTALERFARIDDAARNAEHAAIVGALLTALAGIPGIRVQMRTDAGHGNLPLVEIIVAPGSAAPGAVAAPHVEAPTATALAARLRMATPAVHVEATNADRGLLLLMPNCLRLDDVPLIGAAFGAALRMDGA